MKVRFESPRVEVILSRSLFAIYFQILPSANKVHSYKCALAARKMGVC